MWTAEYGIVVASPYRKVIGLFNAVVLGSRSSETRLAGFALAGDTLIILVLVKVRTVKFTEIVTRPDIFFLPS